MPNQRFTTEEIIHKLREADVLSGQDGSRGLRAARADDMTCGCS